MSDSHDGHASDSSSGYKFAPLLGTLTMIIVPVSMVLLLGVSGYAFVKGGGVKEAPADDQGSAAPAATQAVVGGAEAPTPAPTPAPAAGGAAADGVDPSVMAMGQAAYANCMACHGADGKGFQAGPSMMAPPLVGSEILLGDPDRPLLVVLKGIQKETTDFMGIMAPLGAALDDEKLAAVLTYSRNSFGNTAPAVTVEQAAAARAKFNEVPMMISRPKLDEIVKAHQ